MTSLTSKTVQVVASTDGTKIYVDAIGDPQKPSIVFVHPLSTSGAVFNHIFDNPKYSEEFYLVRYDMRGHGRSGKPDTIEGYSSQLYADDYAAVAHAFKLKNSVLVGWSLGATVAVDIAAHLPKGTIAGLVYLAALPYIGSILGRVGSPAILALLPGLFPTASLELHVQTAITFIDSFFVHPEDVPFELKCAWMGMAALQPPTVTQFVISRPQDPAKLFEAGSDGLPLLVLNGTKDAVVLGDVVVEEMKPHFKDIQVNMIKDTGHAVIYENPGEVMESILGFARRVGEKKVDDTV